MDAVSQLATKLANLNVYQMLDDLFSTSKYQSGIPAMVKRRLLLRGEYSTGEKIETYRHGEGEVYSPTTIVYKNESGQPWDHVTLADTGQFYSSFKLVPKQTFAFIEYDENKPEGLISDNIPDLPEVFGLTETEMNNLKSVILPDLVTKIKNVFSS